MGNVWLVYNRDKTVQGISEVDKEWSSQDERENSATLHKKKLTRAVNLRNTQWGEDIVKVGTGKSRRTEKKQRA
jgi:hypothetical protein